MTLSDLLASDLGYLFATADFATAVTYTAPGGMQTALTAIVYSEYTEDVEQLGIRTKKRLRGCSIQRSELASINQQGTITVDTTEYAIRRVISEDDDVSTVELVRHELMEDTRPNYRRQV